MPSPASEPPPLGSWPRTYTAVVFAAVAVMLCLWWLTAALNHPLGSGR